MIPYIQPLCDSWNALPLDIRWYVWAASGALLLVVFLGATYRFIRYALGHKKALGAWYGPEEYDVLIQSLINDQQAQRRALNHDELKLIRAHLLPKNFKPLHKGKYGGYV